MGVRIDKWLWCVRIYKTRTVAADAVKMNRVCVGGAWVKPSYDVRPGDVVDVVKVRDTLEALHRGGVVDNDVAVGVIPAASV